MKRLLILLILLLATTSYGQQCAEDTQVARLGPWMMGSVPAAASCTTATDELLFDTLGTSSANSVPLYAAVRWTSPAAFTLTEFVARVCRNNSTAGPTISIWTGDETDPDASGLVAGTEVSFTMADLSDCTTMANETVTLVTPVALNAALYYWVVIKDSASSGIRNAVVGSATGNRYCESADGTTWGTCLANYKQDVQVYGCP